MNKGDIGYFKKIKRKEWVKCFIQFSFVIAFLLVGYITTKTKMNFFTLFAVLSCLPASKTLVGVIVKWPIKGLKNETIDNIQAHTTKLTVLYDAILSSKEKIMPVDCLVISDNKIFGYVTSSKVNLEETATYMRNFLKQNGQGSVNIKLFHDFSPFMSRVEGLDNMASVDMQETSEQEREIKHIIQLFCM